MFISILVHDDAVTDLDCLECGAIHERITSQSAHVVTDGHLFQTGTALECITDNRMVDVGRLEVGALIE